ncbi:DNA-binding protein WhiA [Hydrogenispora ethanolica]|uniref:DNA-binding protein WhiA n=1 Tax=Hydrogenispora ethanolica TaxID=1082276 RepID=UPI001404B353|nr:DNA-binding protein WhiA [Hydrogenispora ethanolica]
MVKEEAIRNAVSRCGQCDKAELSAIIHMAGSIHLTGRERLSLSITTESAGIARRIVKLIKSCSKLESEIQVEQNEKLGRLHRYKIIIPSQNGVIELLDELGMMTRERYLESGIAPHLVKDQCCRASFLRGAFLAGGSISDPQKKNYHLELFTHNEEFANGLVYLMSLVHLKAKVSRRKAYFVVYLKESEANARFLSLIQAHSAVIKLEEVRVIKGLRGEVNRRVNCETANLEKTLSAAWEQVEAINQLITRVGLGILPSSLRRTAELRLEYPEATLKELGEYHRPPISKSAVNHRLRLIRQYVKNFTEEAGI